MDQIAGFKAFPVKWPQIDTTSSSPHYFFLKKHVSKTADASDSTLFITQLPICTTRAYTVKALKSIFKRFGQIENVHLHPIIEDDLALTGRGTNAYIVFEDAESLQKALQFDPTQDTVISMPDKIMSASQRWKLIHLRMRPDFEHLQQQVDESMAQYDTIQATLKSTAQAAVNVPDADGWVKVSRAGKNKTNTDGKISVSAVAADQVKKKTQATVPDFYRFQMRQAKRDKLADLRQKFEQDKLKISQMRSQRHFKPY